MFYLTKKKLIPSDHDLFILTSIVVLFYFMYLSKLVHLLSVVLTSHSFPSSFFFCFSTIHIGLNWFLFTPLESIRNNINKSDESLHIYAIRLTVNDFLFSAPSVRFDLWKTINILRGNLCKKGCTIVVHPFIYSV